MTGDEGGPLHPGLQASKPQTGVPPKLRVSPDEFFITSGLACNYLSKVGFPAGESIIMLLMSMEYLEK